MMEDWLSRCLNKAEKSGDVESMYILGCCYLRGNGGVGVDSAAAVRWFQRASEKRHVLALYRLGVCYETGNGVVEDPNLWESNALRFFRQAAEKGHPRSVEKINGYWRDWYEMSQNEKAYAESVHRQPPVKPRERILEAVVQKYFCSTELTGQAQEQPKKQQPIRERSSLPSMTRNDGHSADEGLIEPTTAPYAPIYGHTRVGPDGFCVDDCYSHDLLSYQGENPSSLFSSVASQFRHDLELAKVGQSSTAMNNVGVSYLNGAPPAQNFGQAIHWFQRSAKMGDPMGMTHLAFCYRTGSGVPRSTDNAKVWLYKALNADGTLGYALSSLADILCTSNRLEDLLEAKELVLRVPDWERFSFTAARWLLPFIEDHIVTLKMKTAKWDIGMLIGDLDAAANIRPVALIGRGYFGDVFLCWHISRGWVAVKHIRVSLIYDQSTAVRNILRLSSPSSSTAARRGKISWVC